MDFGTAFDSMNPTQFLESMQQMQQAWSTMGLSASLTPTTDVDEIDKRIANLKAVEQWLNLNLTMLQSSVQALQVQRSTIATLNNLSESMGKQGPLNMDSINKAMAQASAINPAKAKSDKGTTEAGFADPMAWFEMLQQQFMSIASNTMGAPVNVAPASSKAGTQPKQRAAKPKKPAATKKRGRTSAPKTSK